MRSSRLVFRVHAIQRMFERRISEAEVEDALANGETIERYPDDEPFPGRLVLSTVNKRDLHIVVADNKAAEETIVISVYEPDEDQWEKDFRRRKK